MGETAGQVYTDPLEPGAPQVGDVVVVARDMAPPHSPNCGFTGVTTVLTGIDPGAVYSWGIRPPSDEGIPWVHQVRRPTEAELVQWALTHPGGTP